MTDQTLATRAEQAVETKPADEGASLLAIISRAASDPAVDIDKMDRLLQMREREERRAAESAFNEAMNEAQGEMNRIATNKDNSQTKSKYADYAALDRVLRPIYIKHGFALSFDSEPVGNEPAVLVIAHVSRGGFARDYKVQMPTDGKGPQGAAVMTRTHATGAAMTYGMRYLLKMIFNVAIGEDDTDGNMPGDVITEEQMKDLQTKLTEVDGDIVAFCEHFKIAALAELPAKSLSTALKIIENKKRKLSK